VDDRIALLQYDRQQRICHTDHRYGNLGERASEWEEEGFWLLVSGHWLLASGSRIGLPYFRWQHVPGS
jgi:hypothetical protein